MNALLAYFCALNILGNWNKGVISKLHVIDDFAYAHRTSLTNFACGAERIPIFSNSATWYLVEEIYLLKHAP